VRPSSCLLISLALLAGCHQSPESRREDLSRQRTSWNATAQLTQELTARGALPAAYIRQVIEVVEQGRREVRKEASKGVQ
jgi:hypothetical protein